MICPRCTKDLDVNEFGICRARRSGRNLYCKSCNRDAVYAQREARRQMKIMRDLALRRDQAKPMRLFNFPPELRVLRAIKSGAKTQAQIARQAKLFPDDLGLVLVKLIVEQGKVASRVNAAEQREYFLKSEAA